MVLVGSCPGGELYECPGGVLSWWGSHTAGELPSVMLSWWGSWSWWGVVLVGNYMNVLVECCPGGESYCWRVAKCDAVLVGIVVLVGSCPGGELYECPGGVLSWWGSHTAGELPSVMLSWWGSWSWWGVVLVGNYMNVLVECCPGGESYCWRVAKCDAVLVGIVVLVGSSPGGGII